MKNMFVLPLVVIALVGLCWLVNLYKLYNCDFKSDYKCETVHGVGLIVVPGSLIIAWIGTDE